MPIKIAAVGFVLAAVMDIVTMVYTHVLTTERFREQVPPSVQQYVNLNVIGLVKSLLYCGAVLAIVVHLNETGGAGGLLVLGALTGVIAQITKLTATGDKIQGDSAFDAHDGGMLAVLAGSITLLVSLQQQQPTGSTKHMAYALAAGSLFECLANSLDKTSESAAVVATALQTFGTVAQLGGAGVFAGIAFRGK